MKHRDGLNLTITQQEITLSRLQRFVRRSIEQHQQRATRAEFSLACQRSQERVSGFLLPLGCCCLTGYGRRATLGFTLCDTSGQFFRLLLSSESE